MFYFIVNAFAVYVNHASATHPIQHFNPGEFMLNEGLFVDVDSTFLVAISSDT